MTPQAWTDQLVEEAWKPAWATSTSRNDDFIRTTEQRHTERVQRVLADAVRRGRRLRGRATRACTASAARSSSSRADCSTARTAPSCARSTAPVETVCGDQLLLPALRVRRPAARAVRRAARTSSSRESRPQRGHLVRQAGPAGPVDHPVDLRLGHPGAVGRDARPLRLDRRAAELRRPPPGYGTDPERFEQLLAGRRAPGRQGHPAVPRGDLAGHADGRGACRCPSRSSRTAGCWSAARR